MKLWAAIISESVIALSFAALAYTFIITPLRHGIGMSEELSRSVANWACGAVFAASILLRLRK
jgi:hypothetical protein